MRMATWYRGRSPAGPVVPFPEPTKHMQRGYSRELAEGLERERSWEKLGRDRQEKEEGSSTPILSQV